MGNVKSESGGVSLIFMFWDSRHWTYFCKCGDVFPYTPASGLTHFEIRISVKCVPVFTYVFKNAYQKA